MGQRNYIVQGKTITVTNAACTLVHINPPAARGISIIRCWCSQAANATSAQQAIEVGLKATAFPTLTSVTPDRVDTSDPISYITGATTGAAGTAGINASAEGAGAITTKYADAFNTLQGWLWTPSLLGQENFKVYGADSLAFYMKFVVAPAQLVWTFGIEYQEI